MRVLKHHGNILPQIIPPDMTDIYPVNGDRTALNVIKPVDQIGNRRLSCSGGSYKGNLLPRFCIETDILQNYLFRIVAKGHMIERHMPLHRLQHRRVGIVRRFRRLIHHRKHPLRSCQGRKHIADLHGNLINRARELPGKIQEYSQSADIKITKNAQQTADTGSQGIIHLAQISHHRPHDPSEKLRADLIVPQISVEQVEFLLRRLLMAEHLYYLLSGNHLLNIAVDGPQRGLLCGKKPMAPLRHCLSGPHHKRNHNQGYQGKPEIGVDHQKQGPDNA